jgi:arylsulfatase A-like enzyme
MAIPKTVQGRSLVPILNENQDGIYDHVFGYFRSSQRMVRGQEYKLIEYPEANRLQLFHLETDPWELKNLAEEPRHETARRRLLETLRAWQKEMGDPLLNGNAGK